MIKELSKFPNKVMVDDDACLRQLYKMIGNIAKSISFQATAL